MSDSPECPPCECAAAGLCPRHGWEKTPATFAMCKHDAILRAHWDRIVAEGRSPHGVPVPLWRKAYNLTVAAGAHLKGGLERRTQEEIEANATICQTCPSGLFNGRYCEDLDCGCDVTTQDGLVAALAWKSKKCPRNHWK